MTFIFIFRGCQVLQGADIHAKCIYHHFNSCLTLRKTIFIHAIKKETWQRPPLLQSFVTKYQSQ